MLEAISTRFQAVESTPVSSPASQPQSQTRPQPQGEQATSSRIERLWKEPERQEQFRRLRSLCAQSCTQAGEAAWAEAKRIQGEFPEGTRVDVPNSKDFALVLGIYRTFANLPHRPVSELELSAQEIATVTGCKKSAVEAVLRWLGTAPIIYKGKQIAVGLGYVDRQRRKAMAKIDGIVKRVYRTSKTALTQLGRAMVGVKEAAARMLSRHTPHTPRPSPKPSIKPPLKAPTNRAPANPARHTPSQPSEPPVQEEKASGRGFESAREMIRALFPDFDEKPLQDPEAWGAGV